MPRRPAAIPSAARASATCSPRRSRARAAQRVRRRRHDLGRADPGAPCRAARIRRPRRRAARPRLRAVRAGRAARPDRGGLRAPAALSDAPGVIELDAAGALIRASSSAEPLLAELSGSTVEAACAPPRSTPSPARHGRRSPRPTPAPARLPSAAVKTPAGTWLVLHGGLLGDLRAGQIAVFIQRAHPTLVAPLLLKAYGLTPREQEVTQLMLRGATTIQAAQRLAISPHTVTDHMKSIFEKTGARTRGELSATLFFGEHLPRIQDQVPSATTHPSSTHRGPAARLEQL